MKFKGNCADPLMLSEEPISCSASMLLANLGNRIVLCAVGCCALLTVGCASPMVPSQRLQEQLGPVQRGTPIQIVGHQFGMAESAGCSSCVPRQRLKDYVHHAAPYVAGPFHQHLDGSGVTPTPPTVQPPHSKFHPVPTRPVFETRASYIAAQPLGVDLMPIPDNGQYSTEPMLRQPHEALGTPPKPPMIQSESRRSGTTNDPETFMLPPPSE